jgi:uncharacterized protein (TIGR02611 family)
VSDERGAATTDAGEVGSTSRPRRLLETLEGRRERFRARGPVYRWLFVVVGILVVAAGAALLVLPGPGVVVIAIGLAMLALQFDWAERMLARAVDQAERAGEAAAESSPAQRAVVAVLTVLALAAIGVWGYLGDVPLVPVL